MTTQSNPSNQLNRSTKYDYKKFNHCYIAIQDQLYLLYKNSGLTILHFDQIQTEIYLTFNTKNLIPIDLEKISFLFHRQDNLYEIHIQRDDICPHGSKCQYPSGDCRRIHVARPTDFCTRIKYECKLRTKCNKMHFCQMVKMKDIILSVILFIWHSRSRSKNISLQHVKIVDRDFINFFQISYDDPITNITSKLWKVLVSKYSRFYPDHLYPTAQKNHLPKSKQIFYTTWNGNRWFISLKVNEKWFKKKWCNTCNISSSITAGGNNFHIDKKMALLIAFKAECNCKFSSRKCPKYHLSQSYLSECKVVNRWTQENNIYKSKLTTISETKQNMKQLTGDDMVNVSIVKLVNLLEHLVHGYMRSCETLYFLNEVNVLIHRYVLHDCKMENCITHWMAKNGYPTKLSLILHLKDIVYIHDFTALTCLKLSNQFKFETSDEKARFAHDVQRLKSKLYESRSKAKKTKQFRVPKLIWLPKIICFQYFKLNHYHIPYATRCRAISPYGKLLIGVNLYMIFPFREQVTAYDAEFQIAEYYAFKKLLDSLNKAKKITTKTMKQLSTLCGINRDFKIENKWYSENMQSKINIMHLFNLNKYRTSSDAEKAQYFIQQNEAYSASLTLSNREQTILWYRAISFAFHYQNRNCETELKKLLLLLSSNYDARYELFVNIMHHGFENALKLLNRKE
eukprot:276986_1